MKIKFKIYYKYKRMKIYSKLSSFKKSLKSYVSGILFCLSRHVEHISENGS
jgi:hypothetical protein